MTIFQKIVFVILIGWTQCASADESAVIPISEYSNMRATKSDHCYGYLAQIWRHDGTVIGFLRHSEGLCGDSPTGLLENVKYDPKTQALSFNSKISMGCTFNDNKKCVPAIDLVKFNGKLVRTALVGTVTWHQIENNKIFKKENIRLKVEAENSLSSYRSFQEWKYDLKEVFARLPHE